MRVLIADDEHHEELYADISKDGFSWARIIYDTAQGNFVLTISPPPTGGDYEFVLDEVQMALEKAKNRLIELGYGSLPPEERQP